MPLLPSSRPSLEATLELNTPAVLGGARPRRCDPHFKLRPSAVRGGLRYWFRAGVASLLWPEQHKEQRRRDDEMLDQLRDLEAQVFGDTQQRSNVIVLPPKGGAVETWRPIPKSEEWPGLRYLGYGIFEDKALPPERLVASSTNPIELTLALRNTSVEVRQAVAASLWLWTVFGGLGSRSRRGYGSMRLAALAGEGSSDTFASLCTLPTTNQAYLEQVQLGMQRSQDALTELVQTLGIGQHLLTSNGQRPHPHLRTLDGIARLRALNGEHEDPLGALEYAGELFQRYRSSIKRRIPLPDYHAVKESLQPPFRSPQTVARADFGLPLSFCFRSLAGANVRFVPITPDGFDDKQADRVASPLLFRVYALEPKPDVRRYGVMLINLAGRNTTPLLGCKIRSTRTRDQIAAPTAKLIDQFIDWAVSESNEHPPRSTRTTPKPRRRR